MIFPLILGILLGAFTVAFALQNVTSATLTFLDWHFEGSLALILLCAVAVGSIISLLMVLPESIANHFRYRKLLKVNENLTEDLRKQKELTLFAKKTPATTEELEKLDQGRVTDPLQ